MSIALPVKSEKHRSLVDVLPEPFRLLVAAPLAHPRVWMGLGWNDVVQNYRRTTFGPFWITMNLVVFTTAMTLVYGALFGVPTREYAGYVVCGMIAWLWVSALLAEVGNTFFNYAAFLRGMKIDKSLFIWATVYKQAIIFFHHFVVYVALVTIGMITPTLYTLLIIPAFVILFLLSIPVTAMAAILFARYRDLSRLVSSVIIIFMMTTPIFWLPQQITGWRQVFIFGNPIHYLIEFIRGPLLGKPMGLLEVTVVLGMTVSVWIIGAIFFRRYEKYVVFWL